MAYRELSVIELREVWRRYNAGEGVRAIARDTGIAIGRPSPSTWRRPARWACAAARPRRPEDQLAAFGRGVRGTPVGPPAALAERLASPQGQIAAWLTDGLRRTKISTAGSASTASASRIVPSTGSPRPTAASGRRR